MLVRNLLVTTAMVGLLASAASAQQAQTTTAPANAAAQTTVTVKGDGLASTMIGQNVYNSDAQNASKIGDVNDLVIGQDGMVKFVIVGVGGFLGMGEKDVALKYTDFKWVGTQDTNGTSTSNRSLVANASKETLQAMPTFDRSAVDNGMAATAPAANGGTAMKSTGDTTAMAPAKGTATTAATDRANMTPMTPDKLTAENLVGTNVYGADDAKVGDIADIVLDQSKKVDAILIDVGGFLGIGAKRVAIGMNNLKFMQDANGNRYLYTNLTKDQVNGQPEYNADTYSANRDQQRMMVR